MSPLRRIAFIGNALPRRCGIATFTTDLQEAVAAHRPEVETCVIAMTDRGQAYDYPPIVKYQVHEDDLKDYARAADILNAGAFDVVSLQHEFGIFGGCAGEHVLALCSRLTAPLVTTFHTVLANPSESQRLVVADLVRLSDRIVVMAQKARSLLIATHPAAADKIEVIAHGVPDAPFVEPDAAKAILGFADRSVILTFGLLSPNKGVEVMIDAMPAILRRCPDAVYVVLGATHPHLVRENGEAYRDRLIERAERLGVGAKVIFRNQFVDQATLLGYIAMSDVYVTPYLNEAQMTSGTLSYSFGLGKAVVSTPYWHAAELLADERGVLVPFGDSLATGSAIADLLTDRDALNAMRRRAYAAGRPTIWARTADRYVAVFEAARAPLSLRRVPSAAAKSAATAAALPRPRLAHLLAMCDDTGLIQHAVHTTPDRAHGYCVDDNSRALLLTCALQEEDAVDLPPALASRFAAFIQHAWNPDLGRFRNFMGFDRRWLEPAGSEDSHGRTLWALGVCAKDDADRSRRAWASDLFARALCTAESFTSPRAWAFALLGLDAYCAATPHDRDAAAIRWRLAERLTAQLARTETRDWVWYEDGLAYDNARLPQALITSGVALDAPAFTAAGLRTLAWLVEVQTAPTGCFRPVGVDSFGQRRSPPRPFDQQPLEAAATLAACVAAHEIPPKALAAAERGSAADARPRPDWMLAAKSAFNWYLGGNDLRLPLVDVDSGACRDGLHPDRANSNCGAESVWSYLTSLAEMRRLARLGSNRHAPCLPSTPAESRPSPSAAYRDDLARTTAH